MYGKSTSIDNSISQNTKTVKNNTDTKQSIQNSENNTQNVKDNASNIQDFGEKIGGARKDLAQPRTETKITKEVAHDYTVATTENGCSVNFKNKILKDGFKTQLDAEQYILDFKENIKNNMAFVEEGSNGKDEKRYAIKLRNPRTLKSEYIGKVFNNRLDAESYAIALSVYLKEHGKNLFRPQIQKVERINPNIRNAVKATGNDILNNFGFKGGEFGNWVSQTERQEFLNHAQNAFTDLAIALDIDASSLGQNNEMNIAFGSRGKGLTGAVAHFEPEKRVINMTRLKGAGSLAHEYGHSIDNYLSRYGGYDENGMATTNIRNPKLSDNMKNAIDNVINAIKYNISTNQEEINKKNGIYEKGRRNSLNTHLSYLDNLFNGNQITYKYNRKTKQREQTKIAVTDEQKQKYQEIRKILEDGKLEAKRTFIGKSLSNNDFEYAAPIEKLKILYKEVVGRKINDDTIYWLYRYGQPTKQVTQIKSESAFSKSAVELDRATGRKSSYYSKTEEMWARAFEAYVADKLKSKGITNTYLVHSVNNSEYALFNPFPAGEERNKINKAFDNLIQTMKEEGYYKFTNSKSPSIIKDDGVRAMKATKKYNNYTQKELENLNSPKIRIANSEKDVLTFIETAKKIPNNLKLYFGKISTNVANKIQATLGINLNNYNISLKTDAIRHIMNNHSNANRENLRGQIPITSDDILNIPDIINNYDSIKKSGRTEQNKDAITFEKNIDGNTIVVTYVSDKHNNLEIQTMYKFKNNKKRNVSPASNVLSTLNPTSETVSSIVPSENNIPQNGKNVKDDGIRAMKHNQDIRFAKKTAKAINKQNEELRNAEREGSYIEQEIQKIEATGNWDNSIPVTKMTDIKRTIENYLGLGIQKGHFRQQAYGIYKGNRDVIRTKELKDMDTILHETGHALDLGKRLKIDKESISTELLKAAKRYGGYEAETREIQLEEGFAEVIREYTIVPTQAKIDYPQTVAILEAMRQQDSSFNEFITKVQEQTYNYIHQNPRNRTLSNVSIGDKTNKNKFSKEYIKQEVMRNIWDKDWALKSAVNEMKKLGGNEQELRESENAYSLVRLSSGIGDKVTSMLANGYIDENGNKLMPGLNQLGEILENDEQRFNDLRAYLVAQRDLEYKAKTLKTGIRTMDSKTVVEQFKNDYQIQEAAQIVYDTLDGVLQYAVNNHLIPQEVANKLRESNAFYVPMQRVLEGDKNNVGRRGAVADILKARTGSELDIKDVLENIVANSSNIIQQVENNNILKALYNQGEEIGITGKLYDVIDAPMIKIGTAQLNMWESELSNQGVNVHDLDLNKTIDLFAPNNKVDQRNLITSFINDNGKRVYLQFSDEVLFNSLMNMDKAFMSKVLEINKTLNMPLRYGATMANIGFAIPNLISDTAQAAIFSEAGFIPVLDNAIGVLEILAAQNTSVRNFMNKVMPGYADKINTLYMIYEQTGTTSSTRMSQYREATQGIMQDIYGTKKLKTLGISDKFLPLKKFMDLLTYIPEISEQSTRFRVFEKNLELYRNKGMSETDARIKAALQSRDATQDFGRTGNFTREVNQLIPFSAARVGSAYTFVEKVKANPKQVAMRTAILVAVSMAIKAIGSDDDDIQELNQRKKDDNFVIRIGDSIVTIKKPQGILRSMINLAEYIQDLATGNIEEGKEGERLAEWLKNAIMDNAPADEITGLVPSAITPIVENFINKDLYYNSDIVKSYDLELPNSEQYYDYNSQFAIWLGKIFNYSPAKIDNLISGYFAGLGTSITDIMDYTLGKLGVTTEQPEMGAEDNPVGKRFIVNVNSNSSSVDEIYDLRTELKKKENGGTITATEKEQLQRIETAISNMSKLNKQIKAIKKDDSMSGSTKAEKIKVLQEQKTDTARQALGKDLIHASNKSKINATQFYPSKDTLSKNKRTLTLNDTMKKEYEKIANDYYSEYEKQGLYSGEKLKFIKQNAKEYAKNYMMKKYSNKLENGK